MKTKLIIFVSIILVGLIIKFGLPESIQKLIYDKKADLVGTNRTATIYSPFHTTPLKSFTDPDMRYDAESHGWTIWMGSINRKVGISSAAIVIIEDVIEEDVIK